MKKMKWVTSSLVFFLMFGLFAGAGLADGHDDNAMVRVFHASPDAPEVDVYVNGDPAVEGAAFKDITDYLELPAGDHEVAIFASEANGEGDPVSKSRGSLHSSCNEHIGFISFRSDLR